MIKLFYYICFRKSISKTYNEIISLNPVENTYLKNLRQSIDNSSSKIEIIYLKNKYLNTIVRTLLSSNK